MGMQIVAQLADVPMNGSLVVALKGEQVLLTRTDMGVFAIENRCSHAFQELVGGKVKKVFIFCPLHGVRFDMRNGCPSGELTDKPIKVWACEVQGDAVAVDLSRRLDAGE